MNLALIHHSIRTLCVLCLKIVFEVSANLFNKHMTPVLITVLGEIGDIYMMCSVRFGDILLMSFERWVTYSLGTLGVHDIQYTWRTL